MTSLKDKSILILDPSPSIRSSIAKLMEESSASVKEAKDHEEALKLLEEKNFDLIITEANLPNKSGYDFCQELKSNKNTQQIPIILLSTTTSSQDIERGFEAGIAAYVSKMDGIPRLLEASMDVLKRFSFQRKQLIMIVDDSKAIRTYTEDALSRAGFNVITAENGSDALSKLKKIIPNLILSDIEMPEMDGMTFCNKIQQDPTLKSIPFVVMSTRSERQTMRNILMSGAAAYLVKPFNLEQLVITIEKILSDHFILLLKDRERLGLEQKMMLSAITSLITALEARDCYTRGHSESVCKLIEKMGLNLNLSLEEYETILLGARLHDIGKIGVIDKVLLKPGKLTDEEFDIIKKHPTIGATILKPIKSLEPIIPIVKHHHEHLNGKGYPDGLKGDKIPFWARITAVADIYDALTSDRPYRKAMPIGKALQIIEDAKGSQLCPISVELFLKSLDQK